MFEKEAEEWTIDYVCKDCSRYEKCKSKEHCTCKECSKDKWQNGAEFGYQKGIKAKINITTISEVVECEEECELLNQAEQFISEVEK